MKRLRPTLIGSRKRIDLRVPEPLFDPSDVEGSLAAIPPLDVDLLSIFARDPQDRAQIPSRRTVSSLWYDGIKYDVERLSRALWMTGPVVRNYVRVDIRQMRRLADKVDVTFESTGLDPTELRVTPLTARLRVTLAARRCPPFGRHRHRWLNAAMLERLARALDDLDPDPNHPRVEL